MAWEEILVRLIQIVLVPYFEYSVIWVIAPLLFALIMIQMYYGKYKTEQMGWNSAFGNTVSLMWAIAILVKFMYEQYGLWYSWNTPGLQGQIILIMALTVMTISLFVINYNHAIPRKLAVFLSDTIPTTIIAYLSIVIIMGGIPVDIATLIAGGIIFLVAEAVFRLYRQSITASKEIQKRVEEKEKKKKIERRKVKRKIKAKVQKIIPLVGNGKKKKKKRAHKA